MHVYFLLIRIAALFGHRKARLLVRGQASTLKSRLKEKGVADALRGAVWIHAASVGEFEQARPLIERLRNEQPKRKIVLTFFSPSGYELRKGYDNVDAVFYLPFATRQKAQRFIDTIQPSMAIFVKYEFWPAYLHALKKRGIPTYSISAIFRPGQLFFLPWGKGHLNLLKCFTHIYVQDEASRQLLMRFGINHCSVAGDTRFDRVAQVQRNHAQGTKNLTPIAAFAENSTNVIVAGSTWPKDEEMLAHALRRMKTNMDIPDAKLILVPHETDEEHMHFIFNLFQGRMLRYSVLAKGEWNDAKAFAVHNASVLVIDTVGLLSTIYQFGQTAYIGGGFGVGIHNTIEAAVYGIPVIFGPNYHHFREAQGLIDAGAAWSVGEYKELYAGLINALGDHEQMGHRAAQYVETETGATAKIYNDLFTI